MRRGNICPVADLKQHFFLVVGGCRCEYFLAGQVPEIRPHGCHGFKSGFCKALSVPCVYLFQQFNFLVFQFHGIAPFCNRLKIERIAADRSAQNCAVLNRRRVFIVMLIKPHIAVKQCRRTAYALPWALIFHGYNIAVAVGLYACIRQAPFQNRVVIVVDFVCLQVCAQHLHRQGQGFCPLYAAHHCKALHLHFFHKITGAVTVIINPCREQFILPHRFHKPRCHIAVIDRIAAAQSKQAPVKPFVIWYFILLDGPLYNEVEQLIKK